MWYKNVRAQNVLILLFSLIGLASTFYFVNIKLELNDEETHQIQITVFSNIFKYITDHPEEDPDYFFISVSSYDPSPEILTDFDDHLPLIESVSSSEMTFGFSSHVSHKTDRNKRGIIVDLEVKNKQSNGNVQVLASLYRSRERAATYEYILNENEGTYRIISFKGSERSKFLD